MSSDPRVLSNYLHVNTAWNFAIYRAILNYKNEQLIQNNSLRVLLNSAHDVAVIQWCGLFGSNGRNNSTHWSQTTNPWIKDTTEFERLILAPISITHEEWGHYRSLLVKYRNKNIAHIDINDWYRDVPIFDIALKVLFQSYRIFVNNPNDDYDLSAEYEKSFQQTRQLISAMGFNET